MRLMTFVLRNISGSWWRVATLGLFVFLTSFVLIVFNSFSMTVIGNMQDSVINSLTGHVQIRPPQTEEGDMFALGPGWGDLQSLDAGEVEQIDSTMTALGFDFVPRIRQNAVISYGVEQQHLIVAGFNPSHHHYQRAYNLTEGTFLSDLRPGEILLSSTMPVNWALQQGMKCRLPEKTVH